MDSFGLFSPTDYRYSIAELEPFLSEEAFIRYKCKVEAALAEALAAHGICPRQAARSISVACRRVSAAEVYKEEEKTKHDIRALVNVIKRRVNRKAKPFVHLTATSYDIVNTANSLRYRDAVKNVILPGLVRLEKTLMKLAMNEKNTLQIGRTHGQHAEPITFGFALAQYVDRLGERIVKISESVDALVGKFSGAVGAYNATSLLFSDPEKFEKSVLEKLGIRPARISTQIIPPEPCLDLAHCIISCWGVMANLARDMRNLQRSEINEVHEPFEKTRVGSSTMPHKKNPVNFENVESSWKKNMPFSVTLYMDQISEHQRDLTNSFSQRYFPELLVLFASSVRRLDSSMRRLEVDRAAMEKNFNMNANKIVSEPLYVLLSVGGCEDAHERLRKLSALPGFTWKAVAACPTLAPLVKKLPEEQMRMITNPELYVGIASKKTEKIVGFWKKQLG